MQQTDGTNTNRVGYTALWEVSEALGKLHHRVVARAFGADKVP